MILHQHRNPVFYQILSRRVRPREIEKRQSQSRFAKVFTESPEFITVQISSTKDPDQVPGSTPGQKIEISFPDDIRIILTASDFLSSQIHIIYCVSYACLNKFMFVLSASSAHRHAFGHKWIKWIG